MIFSGFLLNIEYELLSHPAFARCINITKKLKIVFFSETEMFRNIFFFCATCPGKL